MSKKITHDCKDSWMWNDATATRVMANATRR